MLDNSSTHKTPVRNMERRPPPNTRVEQTLVDSGRGAAVIQQRMEFQEVMGDRFKEVVERASGRRVIGFMSGNQQEPDLMCEVFILTPTELVADQ